MEPESEHFRHRTENQEELEAEQSAEVSEECLDFDHAEDLIRHDAKQTDVPAAVESRLKQSLADEPEPKRPWWKRWFS